jgi:hypothetical protein
MTRTAYDQAMLDDVERHAGPADDHLCESCGEVVPCDGIACPHCPWPICDECIELEKADGNG